MHSEFWHERWAKNEIGFHQPEFNAHMQNFVGQLGIREGARFLVPLCGKSLDLLWLAQKGYRVTGIEISERAASDFFCENGLAHEVLRLEHETVFHGEGIDIKCMDFFSATRAGLPEIHAVYDRAALVALPPGMRQAYASQLARLVRGGVPALLISLDYPQQEMNGPPFSVPGNEVHGLFSNTFEISPVHEEERLSVEPRFRKKGLTRMEEQVFILRRRPGPGEESS